MSDQPKGAARFGQLTRASSCAPSVDSEGFQRETYVWRPSALLATQLPAIWLELLDKSGERRFTPEAGGVGALCLFASLAGEAILAESTELTPENRSTYRTMRMLFQLGPHLRERLIGRRFTDEDTLHVSRSSGLGFQDVMPDDFGILSEGSQRWSVERLKEEGLRVAREAGVESATPEQRIEYGIDYEAQIHPLDVTSLMPEENLRLLRLAVFDFGPAESPIDEEIKGKVFGRFVDALSGHLDDSTAVFRKWFVDNFDGVIHQISKRKKPDGPIARGVVRQVLLELVFDSWSYVGQTIEIFMRTLAMQIEPPLSASERIAYDSVYGRQSALSGFPLVLLYEQFQAIRPAVLAILNDPENPRCWGRLHRVLQTNATMMIRRREADRVKKRQPTRAHCTLQKSEAELISIREASPTTALENAESVAGVIQALAQWVARENTTCQCTCRPSWKIALQELECPPSLIRFEACCTACGVVQQHSLPMEDVRRLLHDAP